MNHQCILIRTSFENGDSLHNNYVFWCNNCILFHTCSSSSSRTHQRTLILFYFTNNSLKQIDSRCTNVSNSWYNDILHIPLCASVYSQLYSRDYLGAFLSQSRLVTFCLSREEFPLEIVFKIILSLIYSVIYNTTTSCLWCHSHRHIADISTCTAYSRHSHQPPDPCPCRDLSKLQCLSTSAANAGRRKL